MTQKFAIAVLVVSHTIEAVKVRKSYNDGLDQQQELCQIGTAVSYSKENPFDQYLVEFEANNPN